MIWTINYLLLSLIYVNGFIIPNSLLNNFNKEKRLHIKMVEFPSQQIKNFPLTADNQWSYSNFLDQVKEHNVNSVSILNNQKGFIALDNQHELDQFGTQNLHGIQSFQDLNNNLIDILMKNKIPFDVLNVDASQTNPAIGIIDFIFKITIGYFIINAIFSIIMRIRGGDVNLGDSPGGFGNINPLQQPKNDIEVYQPGEIEQRFSDVAGIDIIKNELVEVVDYLKNSTKFESAGAKIPKGVLLEGPPGVGKTLLARAVAGEAGVPFISVSGSQFIEMYVGLGASRVRKLFETARKFKNCIIFIDEIDAVGKQRGGSGITGGGSDEREQTLNQILTEMDGFKSRPGIIVMAATNRIDLLDQALTRPGRFDRKIGVPLPNFEARKKIIGIHCRDKKLSNDISFDQLSSLTSGFSGADIENLMNEACILSVRQDKNTISLDNILEAFEKIQIGLPTDNSNLEYETKELVAYHEAGHSLCALYFNNAFNFSKATIRATSNGAGGYTLFTPIERFNSYPTKKYLLAQLVVSLGGRAAEEVLYRKRNPLVDDNVFLNCDYYDLFVTAGAVSDLQTANSIAETYISRLGFGDDFLSYNVDNGFDSKTSEFTKEKIDIEKRELINNCYNIAVNILEKNENYLNYIAQYLIYNQTLNCNDLEFQEINY